MRQEEGSEQGGVLETVMRLAYGLNQGTGFGSFASPGHRPQFPELPTQDP